ncbi:MAG TPA: PAS domain S-box protein [bacterium]|nr:PAS domain S-box protein [bacterium]
MSFSLLIFGFWLGLARGRRTGRPKKLESHGHKSSLLQGTLDRVLHTIADPVFVKDRDHRWVLLNDACCQFIGHSREKLIGHSDYDFFPKEEADVFWQKDEEVFSTGEVNLNEEAFTDSSGKKHIIVTRKSLYIDADQRPFIVGTIRDVSARRQAEEELRAARDLLELRVAERTAELSRINEELRRSEKQYRNLVETSHDLIWSVDAEGRWTFLSRDATRRIYGYEAEEMLGRVFTEFEKPEQAVRDLEVFAKVKAGQPYFHYETEHLKKDGTPVYLSFNAIVARDSQGKVIGTTGTANDVTARRLAEEKLRESEERIRTIIDHAMDAIVVLDSQGKITYWNPQAERCFGWSALEAMGRSASELIMPPEHRDIYEKLMQRFLKTGHEAMMNRRVETTARHSDGHEFPVEISVSPLRWGGEHVFSAFVRDITERKQAEEAIRQKTEELARSNKELQDFAYVASHDLQEPLHKIIAFGDRLRDHSADTLSEKAHDSLDRIQRAALRMRQLIDDLLLYARVTTRAKPFQEVDLSLVIREVLSVLEWRIAESKARIEVGELPVIEADRSQMLQLFQNLMSNALKFAKPGEAPEVRIHGQTGADGQAEIWIEDRGIGFEEKFAELIFKPFQRLHGRNEYEGTGMGLAICQKIVARHGGSIEVNSRLGEKTVFKVKLPVHPPRAQAA